jgi:hypothetical protein
MDDEVKGLLEQLESKMIGLIEETDEIKDAKNYFEYFEVKYGWRKSWYFRYNMEYKCYYDENKPYMEIACDTHSGWVKITEAYGKSLKILCQDGDKILKNFVSSFKNEMERTKQFKLKDKQRREKERKMQVEKELKQAQICKTNLKKLLT